MTGVETRMLEFLTGRKISDIQVVAARKAAKILNKVIEDMEFSEELNANVKEVVYPVSVELFRDKLLNTKLEKFYTEDIQQRVSTVDLTTGLHNEFKEGVLIVKNVKYPCKINDSVGMSYETCDVILRALESVANKTNKNHDSRMQVLDILISKLFSEFVMNINTLTKYVEKSKKRKQLASLIIKST